MRKHHSRWFGAAALLLTLCNGASIPLGAQKTFGHSIKNGALPAQEEVTVFEHACAAAPCVVTQLFVPSIYPGRGDAWNWTQGVLSFYVDQAGAETTTTTTPTFSLTLLELGGESHFNAAGTNAQGGDSMPDGSPWGIAMMGRTAKSGAVYSTVRIPFGASLRVTIRAAPSARAQSTFWCIIRGLEAHAVLLGDLQLPAAARLVARRLPPQPVAQLQLLTLAQAPAGVGGALLRVQLDARGPTFGYLEACMRFYADGATEATPGAPLFLSSGAEDYFLSASYFDEGLFKTPNSGLTYFNRSTSSVGAYKTHDADPVLWRDGMKLVFRVCESTGGCGDAQHCPNQFCNATQRAAAAAAAAAVKAAPAFDEYFLGAQGASCDAACAARGLLCNSNMDLGPDADRGAAMMAHLNISGCLKNATDQGHVAPLQWWAKDQPGYISGAEDHGAPELNYRQCLGFVGYPKVGSSCEAAFPTNSRICHCTETAPPTPAPAPSGTEYATLVLSYEWPKEHAAVAADAAADAAHATRAPLRLVRALARRGALTEAEENGATDLLVAGDAAATRLLSAFDAGELDGDDDGAARVARHLRRYLAKRLRESE